MDIVFIVGVGRSGTTLLQSVLNSQRRVSVLGENPLALRIFQGFYELSHYKSSLDAKYSSRPDSPWWGLDRISLQRLARLFHFLMVSHLRAKMCFVKVSGMKEIRWFEIKGALEGAHLIFPEAKFLFINRDIGGVASSGWWRNNPKAFELVEQGQKYYRQKADALGKQAFWVEYEELVGDAKTAQEVFQFLRVNANEERYKDALTTRLHH